MFKRILNALLALKRPLVILLPAAECGCPDCQGEVLARPDEVTGWCAKCPCGALVDLYHEPLPPPPGMELEGFRLIWHRCPSCNVILDLREVDLPPQRAC